MPLLSLSLPPGVFRNGTKYQAKGRWYDANLVRWTEKAMMPIGGWRGLRSSGSLPLLVDGDDPTTMAWAGAATVALSASTAPNFTTTAYDVEDDAAGATEVRSQDIVITAADYGLWSFVINVRKDVTAPVMRFALDFKGGAVSAAAAIAMVFDPDTGAYNADATSGQIALVDVVVTTEPLNADWWKVVWTVEQAEANDSEAIGVSIAPAARADVAATAAVAATTGTNVIWTPGVFRSPEGDVNLREPVLGMLAWRDNSGVARLSMGVPSRAWAWTEGGLQDITPEDFVEGVGTAELVASTYGAGAYGFGPYGVGDTSLETLVEAQTWQFDTFGQFLVACATSDGRILYWTLGVDERLELVHASAPTDCIGIVVTPERFLVALGADSDPRKVQWADQQSLTVWTPTTENQAGDFTLPGSGGILTARRSRGETLIWTTQDLFAMRYIGGLLIYSFNQVGSNCGPISRRAVAMVDGGRAFWMGTQNFYLYNGFVQPVPCDVRDYVFNDINRLQASKIHATTLAEFHEVTFYYCSAGSDEIDRYVTLNYLEGHWALGTLNRTSGVDRGTFEFPLLADRAGAVYEHERGGEYLDVEGDPLLPTAESGPIEIGSGDNLLHVRYMYPDETTLGDVQGWIYTAAFPTAAEAEFGPFNMANPTPLRLAARQMRFKIEQVEPGWRLGVPRFEMVPGSER